MGGLMKFFLTIFLLCTLMLALSSPYSNSSPRLKTKGPEIIRGFPLKSDVLDSFDQARNGHAFWAFLTGDKQQVSPKLKRDFNQLELGFLFSPSGLHLSAFLFLLICIFKKFLSSKTTSRLKLLCYGVFYFFPSFAIKRIVILRLLIFLKLRLKKSWALEKLFIATFAISFMLGHYFQSPLGFIKSFLFMGTFISLRVYSRWIMLLGLFIAHLLLALFSGHEVSPLALLLNIPLLSFFGAMMSLSAIYLVTFKWIQFNWMENLVAFFLWMIKKSVKLVVGTQLNTSIFLLLGLWIILLKKDKRWLVLCFFLHANLAHSPALFSQIQV